jgi:hypothetical protein
MLAWSDPVGRMSLIPNRKKSKDNSLFCSINRYIFLLSKPAPTL